jgi:hypothetical protein
MTGRSIHDQIVLDAVQAQARAKSGRPILACEFSSLEALVESATRAVFAVIPKTFEHCGKTYFLELDIEQARLAVFKDDAAKNSMLVSLIRSPNWETQRRKA